MFKLYANCIIVVKREDTFLMRDRHKKSFLLLFLN